MGLKNKLGARSDGGDERPKNDSGSQSDDGQRPRKSLTPFERLPLDCLPVVLQDYVQSVSLAIGCDPSLVVLPLLAVLAGAIGNARRLRLKRSWFAPPILWTAVVGDSGIQKSPPFRAVTKPLKLRQQQQIEAHAAAMAGYKSDLVEYKREAKKYDRTGEGQPPMEPQKPPLERCLVSDSTIEGLVPILQDNWRGVVLIRDELVGWIGGFDKYGKAGTASTDSAHWLSIYNADAIVVDRKTGEPRTLFVPDPCVSVSGTIQPGILHRALGDEHRENGLAARMLMACPPRTVKRWTDAEVPEEREQSLLDLVDRLFDLQPDTDADGKLKPGVVFLSDDARREFIEFFNATGDEQATLSGDLAASWAKLEEAAARLALVFHCVRQVTTKDVDPWECDVQSMQSGIALVEWFKRETERIQILIAESAEERELRRLAEYIDHRGGRMRERDLITYRRDITSQGGAELRLQALVSAGFGEWIDVPSGPRGGRPTREFVLHSASVSAEPG
ncbi:MAG: hypothetical protein Fues2KO_00840 [Fuerstiella sp.]